MEQAIINSATLSSTLQCTPFNALFVNTNPILRVAIEPKKQSEFQVYFVCKIKCTSLLCRKYYDEYINMIH